MNYARSEIIDAFHKAVSTALEDMAFDEVDIIQDKELIGDFEAMLQKDDPDTAMIWSQIELNSPLQGHLTVIMEKKYAEFICGELLGFTDENLPDEIIKDASAEMLNTIGGCFMKELIPPNQEYKIGFPTAGMHNPETGDEYSIPIYFKVNENTIKGIVSGIYFE